MDCKEINQPALLVDMLRSEQESIITRVIKCIYAEYEMDGLHFCYSRIFNRYPVRKERHTELFNDSFSMAVTKFVSYLRINGFYSGKGAVKTVFLRILRYDLRDAVVKAIKDDGRLSGKDPSIIFEDDLSIATSDSQTLAEELEKESRIVHIAEEGFKRLGERCQHIIRWKREKVSNEEIARRMGTIQASSITQANYECMQKYRKIVSDLKKEQ